MDAQAIEKQAHEIRKAGRRGEDGMRAEAGKTIERARSRFELRSDREGKRGEPEGKI